jgi:hypothetical protein
MFHWNYRVVKRIWYQGTPREEIIYEVHEAHYGIGKKPSITKEPVAAAEESVEGLREHIQCMLRALDKPVLDYETMEEI